MLAVWSGDISANTVWTSSEIHQIVGNVRVVGGATLTIEPGTTIKFIDFQGLSLTVEGKLLAQGSADQRIVFTSLRDDTIGGDTNGDGATSAPGAGFWNAIRFAPGSTGSIVSHAEVRYGGGGSAGGAILVDGGGLSLTHSKLQSSATSGIRVQNSNPVLTNVVFAGNAVAASMDLGSSPVISGVTMAANGVNALLVDGGTLGTSGQWDDPDITYLVNNTITIPADKSLSIGAGQIVKFREFAGLSLLVDGRLTASGTATNPVIFTGTRDDAVGTDAYNDGPLAVGAGHWRAIQFNATSTASSLDHVELRYGGSSTAALIVDGAPLTLTNSKLQASANSGIRIQNAAPTLTNVTFQSNAVAASMDLGSNPEITGVTMTGNGVNALLVDGGSLSADLTWNDPHITYLVNAPITVPAGKTLSVAAGQVVKFREFGGVGLHVIGTLTATGTPVAPVVFTGTRDDAAGTDAYNDGATSVVPGQWESIRFGPESTGNALSHVEVRYGGANAPAVVIDGASATLTHTKIQSAATTGLRIQDSNPALSNLVFQQNLVAASMDLGSNPAIAGVTMAGNGTNALVVDGGALTADGSWNDPDITYLLNGPVTVPAGRTLSVAAGQIIKLREFAGVGLSVSGSLIVSGSAAAPVIFTGTRDDSVGNDVYSDGPSPAGPGQWESIRFHPGSTANSLRHVEVRYGGANAPAVVVDGAALTLSESKIHSSATTGLRLQNSNPILGSLTFQQNAVAASMDLGSNPAITGVTMVGNGTNALVLDGGDLTTSGSWDDPDITYLLSGTVTVPAGKSLSVAAGQVIKFREFAGVGLIVNGQLQALGSAAAPAIFTGTRDDSVGGDAYNDGTTPVGPGHWGAIQFNNSSTGNRLDHVEVRYGGSAGAAVFVNGGPLALSHSKILASATSGIRIQGSSPTLSNLTYQNNFVAASMDLAASPAITGVTMLNNGTNALVLDGGELAAGGTWDDPDITYLLNGTVSVPAGKILAIAAGQVIKVREFAGLSLLVDGSLTAHGQPGAPVIFTGTRDDSVGTDVYNDGPTPVGPGHWTSIRFSAGSTNNVLKDVEVRYGGGAAGALVVDAASVSLTNSRIQAAFAPAIRVQSGGAAALVSNVLFGNSDAAVLAESGATVTAVNNTIDGNFRGVHADGAATTVTLTNNLITNHTRSGVLRANSATIHATFNDVFNPAAASGNYEGWPDQTDENNNISVDPKYFNRAAGRFELRSGSPVIDSANSASAPLTDFLGNPRFDDPGIANLGGGTIAFVDRGAYERQDVSDPINLVITSAQPSSNQVQIDDALTLNWTVHNNQIVPAEGSWTDAVFVSLDDKWDLADTLVATFERTGGLAPGASYDAQVVLTMPPQTAGPLFFIVRTDSRKVIRESLEADNDKPLTATLSVPELTSGTSTSGQFTAVGQSRYYRLTPTPGNTVLITLDSTAATGAIEMYLRKDAIPTPSAFDARFQSGAQPDQELILAAAEPGTFYLLVQNVSAPPASFVLQPEVIPFSVRSVSPSQVGNGGFATVQIRGAQFAPQDAVSLRAPDGSTVPAKLKVFQDAANIVAEFDLTGQAAGPYDVVVDKSGVAAIGNDLVQVDGAQPGEPVVQLIGPSTLRRDRIVTYTATVRNASNNDVVLPLLSLNSHGNALLGFTPDTLRDITLSIVPRTEGISGLLRPGETWKTTIYAKLLPSAISPVSVTLDSYQFSSTPTEASRILGGMFEGVALADIYGPQAPKMKYFLDALTGPTNADFLRTIYAVAGTLYPTLPLGRTLTVEDVWQQAFETVSLIVEKGLLSDQFYADQGIILDSSAAPTGAEGLLAEAAAAVCECLSAGDQAVDHSNDPVVQIAGESATQITTRWPGNPSGGKVRYISAGFNASEFPYGESDFPKVMADALHCLFPNDTIKVVNWRSGSFSGMGGTVAGFAGGGAVIGTILGGPLGTFIGIKTGTAIGAVVGGGGYYASAARLTEDVGKSIAFDVNANSQVDPSQVVLYGHSLGSHVMGFAGKSLQGKVDKIVGFDPAGELFGGDASQRLDPTDARLVQAIHTSRVFGHKTNYVFGTDPQRLGSENYYPKDTTTSIPIVGSVEAHALSYNLYLARLQQRCEEIKAGTRQPGDDSGLLDGISTDPNQPGTVDPDPTQIGQATPPNGSKGSTATVVQAIDPNDLLHPAGFGPQGWVPLVDPLPYTILFENDPAKGATAPAQEVIILNTLAPELDWNTFELGSLGFGSVVVPVPPGLRSFSADVDTTNQDESPLRVHIEASLNLATGQFRVVFLSLDPATGQFPADALAGFLPVNDATHRGEGFVTYTIFPKSSLATGAQVTNQASIIFDTNEPLETPLRLNTFDNNAPASHVLPLPAKQNASFNLKWTGSDSAGAGIRAYDVFVSEDGGPYELFQNHVTTTSATFTGIPGRTYRFYAAATDNVGHAESVPLGPDATTEIGTLLWHNYANSLDVTGPGDKPDGIVLPADALAVINRINAFGPGDVPPTAQPGDPYYDTTGGPGGTGDNRVLPSDVLAVINFLNAFGLGLPGPSGEGEAAKIDSALALLTAEGENALADRLDEGLALLFAVDSFYRSAKRRR